VTRLYAYNADEASGPFLDVSGNGRDIALTGAIIRTAAGTGYTYGGAHPNAKGMSHSTTAAESGGPALPGLQPLNCTLMAWVKRTNNSQIGWFGELKTGGSGDRGILLGLSGNVAFRCRNASNTAATPGFAQPAVGTWYHVAGTYSAADALVRLFINGSQVASAALTPPLKTTSTGTHLFDTLGPETIIRDLQYHDLALTAAEITALMSVPVSAAVPAFSGWGVPI
jgi:hypothetical protein